jgi:tetratricopeptide (TPR) repeat protein
LCCFAQLATAFADRRAHVYYSAVRHPQSPKNTGKVMDKKSTLERAKDLRHADELDASQSLLLELLNYFPGDPEVLFEVGGSYDVMGDEAEAVPYYEQAIEKGLEGSQLQECMVCLGSSYRNLGDIDEAVEILQRAAQQFPENRSGQVFLALAHYSAGRYADAVGGLLDLLLKTSQDPDILAYADPLDYYKDNLDELLEE